jgi:hypothetical protein
MSHFKPVACRALLAMLSIMLVAQTVRAADAPDATEKKTAAVPKPTAPPEPEGMKLMFNGKNLDGWDGDPRLWSVKDGVIHGEDTKENTTKGNTFLIWTGGEPGDFEMRVTFRMDPDNKPGSGNSGIQYRSKRLPDTDKRATNKWVMSGYQAEIANVPGKDGFLYHEKGPDERKREDKQTPLYLNIVGDKAEIDKDGVSHIVGSLGDRAAIGSTLKLNDWNDYVIIAKGNHLQHFINGIQTIDCIDNDPKGVCTKGQIAFQIHAGQPMVVEFKNPRIKIYDEKPAEAAAK